MQLHRLSLAAILALLPAAAAAQSAGPVVAAASKAMGADSLTSITYSGTARNGAFGQSKAIGNPLGPVNTTRITQYTRTINFGTPADSAALVSRATGPTQPPTVPGVPAPMPGDGEEPGWQLVDSDRILVLQQAHEDVGRDLLRYGPSAYQAPGEAEHTFAKAAIGVFKGVHWVYG